MKKLLLLSIFILVFTSIYAQEEKYIYCEIVGTSKVLSTKVTVEIDYGQASSYFSNNRRLRGDDGKPIAFNSMVDAMNMLGDDGWVCVQAYAVTIGQQNVYHWLLKKDVSLLTEEEKEGLLSTYRTTRD